MISAFGINVCVQLQQALNKILKYTITLGKIKLITLKPLYSEEPPRIKKKPSCNSSCSISAFSSETNNPDQCLMETIGSHLLHQLLNFCKGF